MKVLICWRNIGNWNNIERFQNLAIVIVVIGPVLDGRTNWWAVRGETTSLTRGGLGNGEVILIVQIFNLGVGRDRKVGSPLLRGDGAILDFLSSEFLQRWRSKTELAQESIQCRGENETAEYYTPGKVHLLELEGDLGHRA